MIDPFDEDAVTAVPWRLLDEVGFFHVPASRTGDRQAFTGSMFFRRLISFAGKVPASEVMEQRDQLRSGVGLEDSEQLRTVVAGIESELARLFPQGPRLQLRLTGTDSESVLRAVVPHFQYPSGPSLPLQRQGSGLSSLQALMLVLEFGRVRREAGREFILAVEEPEIHLPPGLQRQVIHRVQALAAQTIVSSNSTTVAALYPPTHIRVMEKSGGNLKAKPLLATPLTNTSTNGERKTYRDFRADVVAALMHEGVLVPEGRTDFEWIRLLVRCVEVTDKWPASGATETALFGSLVGVVPTQDAHVTVTFKNIARVRSRVAALVDGDNQGDDYVKALLAATPAPAAIIQWPKGWTVEDVIAWILAADIDTVLNALKSAQTVSVESLPELTSLLKKELKGNYLAYEHVADVIASSEGCLERTRQLLDCLAQVISRPDLGAPGFHLDARSPSSCPVWVLTV